MFAHQLIVDGRAEGTWRPVRSARAVTVQVTPWAPLAPRVNRALQAEIERYVAFAAGAVERRD